MKIFSQDKHVNSPSAHKNQFHFPYYKTDALPKKTGWLAEKLLSSFTNEVEFFKSDLEPCGKYPVGSYKQWYENLGVDTRNHIKNNWGEMPGNSFLTDTEEEFKIAGFKQGNIFIGVQPPRIAFGDIQKSFHNGDISQPLVRILVPDQNIIAIRSGYLPSSSIYCCIT